MFDTLASGNIAQVIQLSVAPVFLLVAIGSFLNVVTQRLGRVVDRARRLEEMLMQGEEEREASIHMRELKSLDTRMSFANWSINLCSFSALLVAIDVALLFVGSLTSVNVTPLVAFLFILSMAGIIGGLMMFLLEISIATQTVRVRSEFLKNASAQS